MLDDGAEGELSDGPTTRGSVAAPPHAMIGRPVGERNARVLRPERRLHGEGVRHPAQDGRVAEAVGVFLNQALLAKHRRIFEARQVGIGLGDEQRIVRGERGNELRIDREVIFGAVTGAARAAVAGKRFLEEELRAAANERIERFDLARELAADARVAGDAVARDRR